MKSVSTVHSKAIPAREGAILHTIRNLCVHSGAISPSEQQQIRIMVGSLSALAKKRADELIEECSSAQKRFQKSKQGRTKLTTKVNHKHKAKIKQKH